MTDSLTPTLLPLGDRALLIRFAEELSDAANRAAIGLARQLASARLEGVEEIAPGLVSVLLRLSPTADFMRLSGEIRMRMGTDGAAAPGAEHTINVTFDGADLPEIAAKLSFNRDDFVFRHNAAPLRVLGTGFAPGFVYCGFHPAALTTPRREAVRPMVPAGTVLFAAGQTAIAATPIRTGWHVIGRTAFQNFNPAALPPTILAPGDTIRFTEVA
ncbi:MAG: carboxyltransferase domain-containing protein [Devosia sp.]